MNTFLLSAAVPFWTRQKVAEHLFLKFSESDPQLTSFCKSNWTAISHHLHAKALDPLGNIVSDFVQVALSKWLEELSVAGSRRVGVVAGSVLQASVSGLESTHATRTAAHTAAWTADKLILFGGLHRPPEGPPNYSSQVTLAHLSAGGHVTLKPLKSRSRLGGRVSPSGRAGHSWCHVTPSQLLYLFGGLTEQGFSDELFVFNIKKESWRKIEAKGPCARAGHQFVRVNATTLLLFGGQNEREYLADMWLFNLEAEQWTHVRQEGQIPSPRSSFSLVTRHDDSRLYLFGGMGPDGLKNDLLSFSLELRRWTKMATDTALPARMGHSMWHKANSLYIIGGYSDEADRRVWVVDLDMLLSGASPSVGPNFEGYGQAAVEINEELFLLGGNVTLPGGSGATKPTSTCHHLQLMGETRRRRRMSDSVLASPFAPPLLSARTTHSSPSLASKHSHHS